MDSEVDQISDAERSSGTESRNDNRVSRFQEQFDDADDHNQVVETQSHFSDSDSSSEDGGENEEGNLPIHTDSHFHDSGESSDNNPQGQSASESQYDEPNVEESRAETPPTEEASSEESVDTPDKGSAASKSPTSVSGVVWKMLKAFGFKDYDDEEADREFNAVLAGTQKIDEESSGAEGSAQEGEGDESAHEEEGEDSGEVAAGSSVPASPKKRRVAGRRKRQRSRQLSKEAPESQDVAEGPEEPQQSGGATESSGSETSEPEPEPSEYPSSPPLVEGDWRESPDYPFNYGQILPLSIRESLFGKSRNGLEKEFLKRRRKRFVNSAAKRGSAPLYVSPLRDSTDGGEGSSSGSVSRGKERADRYDDDGESEDESEVDDDEGDEGSDSDASEAEEPSTSSSKRRKRRSRTRTGRIEAPPKPTDYTPKVAEVLNGVSIFDAQPILVQLWADLESRLAKKSAAMLEYKRRLFECQREGRFWTVWNDETLTECEASAEERALIYWGQREMMKGVDNEKTAQLTEAMQSLRGHMDHIDMLRSKVSQQGAELSQAQYNAEAWHTAYDKISPIAKLEIARRERRENGEDGTQEAGNQTDEVRGTGPEIQKPWELVRDPNDGAHQQNQLAVQTITVGELVPTLSHTDGTSAGVHTSPASLPSEILPRSNRWEAREEEVRTTPGWEELRDFALKRLCEMPG